MNVVDLGLRLADVRDMGLSYEEYAPAYWDSRLETLERHGASQEEISILETKRVELNAMPSDVFIRFLERKMIEHGVEKVVPDDDALTAHARNVMERALTNKALGDIRTKAHTDAHNICLPDDLKRQVQIALQAVPERPWDRDGRDRHRHHRRRRLGCVGSVSRVRSRRCTVTVMTAPLTPTERKRLADLFGRLGSDHPGERDNAGVMAHRLIKTRGLSWPEILDPAPPVERSSPEVGTWRSTCLELQKRSGSLRTWERKLKFQRISTKQRYVLSEIAERVLRSGRPA